MIPIRAGTTPSLVKVNQTEWRCVFRHSLEDPGVAGSNSPPLEERWSLKCNCDPVGVSGCSEVNPHPDCHLQEGPNKICTAVWVFLCPRHTKADWSQVSDWITWHMNPVQLDPLHGEFNLKVSESVYGKTAWLTGCFQQRKRINGSD